MAKYDTSFLRRRLSDEDGSFTVLSLYFIMAAMILGGIAIDFANWTAKEAKLQSASDSVAHAALYLADEKPPSEAISGAMQVALENLPAALHGSAIQSSDIEFGVWDADTQTFTPDPGSTQAVRVSAARSAARNNPINNLILRIIGFSGFESFTPSIWEAYEPTCLREGFVAERMVDMQSNNTFQSGFCIHSNRQVKLSSGNTFEENTHVTLPNTSNVILPSSGMDSNEGFEEALDDGALRLRILRKMETIIASIDAGGTKYLPDYITSATTVNLYDKQIRETDIVSGSVHRRDCATNEQMNIVGGLYSNMVLITNCKIKFQNGVVLEDAMIISTSTTVKAMSSTQGLQLGRNDNCAPGGGATLLTYGGFEAAANLQSYGGQIMAKKSIEFSANADGIQGVSFIAGQDVIGNSNMNMGFCNGAGMENAYTARYFRMVQ